jgi:predicted MPP superfamily phosphohydrolase
LAIEPPLPPVEAGFRLLLSHGPRCFGWAASNGIDLMLAGHVHGGQVNLPLLGPVYGHGYDAGIFQAGPTVLHIVRGLGQLTPIRLHCRPEVTRLVLRRGN